AVMAAVNTVELPNAVVRFELFQRTVAPLTNPLPFTVRVKAAAPAVALVGDSEEIVGTGLLGAEMVKVALPEVPPPGVGLKTVTIALPAAEPSAAVMAAVNCLELPSDVVRFEPFQRTVAPLTNPVPFTVRVKAA